MTSKTVLVGVLKDKRDREILLGKHWYRIPAEWLPKKKFTHLAFYQPAVFGKDGKRIEYYARLVGMTKEKRVKLLPNEASHPRAGEVYIKCEVADIEKLVVPIRNIIPRRVSFGFTSLKALKSAHDILQLYGVPATEQIVARRLKRLGVQAKPEFTTRIGKRRFRIDLAIFPLNGKIAIECDNNKAHQGKFQRGRDKLKDKCLRRDGWKVVRLSEDDIIERIDQSITKIMNIVGKINSTVYRRPTN